MNPTRPRPLPSRPARLVSDPPVAPSVPPRPRSRTRGLWITLAVLTLALAGASTFGHFTRKRLLEREASLASVSAELEGLRARAKAAEDEKAAALAKAKTLEESAKAQGDKLSALESELQGLKQTAQYQFDQATQAAVADTDEGDKDAIAKMEELIQRWPLDPLVTEARKRIEDYQKRGKKRADALAQAQDEVRQQIKRCEAATAGIKASQDKSMVFDDQGELDVSVALAGTRKQEALKKAAGKAKAEAKRLLEEKGVPDPDGALAKAAEICDVGE